MRAPGDEAGKKTRWRAEGVMNGPLKFLTARKILPLLNLLAKFKRVLACSCSSNFCVARKLAKCKMGLTGLHDSPARVQNSLFIVWL